MMAIHNHPGYSNCPKCVARILELEAELAGYPKPLHEAMDALKRMHARAEKAEADLAHWKQQVKVLTARESARWVVHGERDCVKAEARADDLLKLAEDCYGVLTCEHSYYDEELGARLQKFLEQREGT